MISVCIATYNGEKHLKAQLDSILCQLGAEDEVVVSDDGSTDGTLSLLNTYQDPRIKVFHHDSSTVTTTFPLDKPTHNFEHALRQAQGDIIFLSDQDDIWMPNKVSTMLQALETSDLAIHDCIVTDEELHPILPSYFQHIGIHRGVLHNMVKATYLGCCMAMRREVAEAALPFPKTKVGHDLWLGIVADMKFRTALVHEPLIHYRKHQESMTTSGMRSHYGLGFKLNYRMTILWETLQKACLLLLMLSTFLTTTSCTQDDDDPIAQPGPRIVYAVPDLEKYTCDCPDVLDAAIQACQTSPNRKKTIGVFGGSISSLYESWYAKTYWIRHLSATVYDYGAYGQGFVTTSGNMMQQVDRAQVHDIYILWCSTNDWTSSIPAGEATDYTKPEKGKSMPTTQCGGMNYCISKLLSINPSAQIYIFGSAKWFSEDSGGYLEDSPIPNATGKNFYYYVKKQREVAQARGIPYLSQWDIPQLCLENAPTYFKADKVHLTPTGYVNIGPYQLYLLATGTEYKAEDSKELPVRNDK